MRIHTDDTRTDPEGEAEALLLLDEVLKRRSPTAGLYPGAIGDRLLQLEEWSHVAAKGLTRDVLAGVITGAAKQVAADAFDERLSPEESDAMATQWAAANIFSANPVRKRLADAMTEWIREV